MNDLIKSYENSSKKKLNDARSLPFGVYTNPEVYDLEVDKIFHNDWVFACAEAELAQPGHYFAFKLAGEAVAVIRGKDNQLRALSNICRHRGTPLLDEGYGTVDKHIVCPYHAWTYEDTGELKAVPLPGNIKIDKQNHCLPLFHVDTLLGLVFINLSDNPISLKKRFEGLADYCEIFEPHRFTTAYHSGRECWNANWKLAMENGMESYHLFKVHKETLETVTPTKQAFYVAGSTEWTITAGKMLGEQSFWSKWISGETPEAYSHYLLLSLAPNFIGILTYESFDWIQVLPEAPNQCIINAGGISTSSPGDKAEQAFTKAFFAEDKFICERVQQGMYSRKTQGGKLVELEQIVVDFHQYLANRLFHTNNYEFSEGDKAKLFLS